MGGGLASVWRTGGSGTLACCEPLPVLPNVAKVRMQGRVGGQVDAAHLPLERDAQLGGHAVVRDVPSVCRARATGGSWPFM